MNKLILWFVKITGFIPELLVFRRKTLYENKKNQSRRIKGRALIVSNHTSVFDVASAMFLFPFRDLYFITAELMFQKNKLFSWFLKRIGAIKVNRNVYDFKFVDESVKFLNKNKVVLVYPESRLPLKDEERPLPFKPSTVLIALKTHAPIIPIYTDGNYFNSKRNNVIIGEKIYLDTYYDNNKSEKENVIELNNLLRNKIIDLGNILNERKQKEKK